jgi:hypothetical protein
VTPVRQCESAAGVGAVLGEGERRLRTKGEVRQVDATVRHRGLDSSVLLLPPPTIPGSVIVKWPSIMLLLKLDSE